MDSVPFSKLIDARAASVVIDQAVHLSGREESLKIPNSPHHLAPRVLDRGSSDPL